MDVGDYFKRQMGVNRLSDVYQRAFQLASPTEVENGRYQTFLLAQLIHKIDRQEASTFRCEEECRLFFV